MSVEIAWKQNILVTDSYLLKLLLVVFGLGLQAFVCDFSRQNICSVCNESKYCMHGHRMEQLRTQNVSNVLNFGAKTRN